MDNGDLHQLTEDWIRFRAEISALEKKNRELKEEFATRALLSRTLYIKICQLSAGGAMLRTEIIKLRNELKSWLGNSRL